MMEQFPVAAVAIDVSGENARGPLFSSQDDCAGTIAEKAAGIPVGPVNDTGKDLRPDDEDAGGNSGFDELVRNGEGVGKPEQAAEISKATAPVAPRLF